MRAGIILYFMYSGYHILKYYNIQKIISTTLTIKFNTSCKRINRYKLFTFKFNKNTKLTHPHFEIYLKVNSYQINNDENKYYKLNINDNYEYKC